MVGIEIDSFRRIFHPTDFSHGSDVAFAHALKLAVSAKSSLEILHVDKDPRRIDWDDFPSVRDTLIRWQVLEEGASREDVARTGATIEKVNAKGTKIGETILLHAEEFNADLVVLATHRREGFDRWLHKEIAASVVNRAKAAALFVPYGVDGFVGLDDGKVTLKNIIMPVCHDPKPQVALDAAAWVASALDSKWVKFTAVHVGDEADMPNPTTHAQGDWSWNWENREGDVVEQVVTSAREHQADLIVMTTHGHDGFMDAIRGSTTEQVLQHAPCPVLAVHSRGR